MSDVQIIRSPGGEEMVVLPKAEYRELIDAVDAAEHQAVLAGLSSGAIETLADADVDAYLVAATPLAFWRQHRGLTQTLLAREVGISQSFLAEIEAGKKTGEPALWKRLATRLRLRMEDLVTD